MPDEFLRLYSSISTYFCIDYMRRISVITGSRADASPLANVIRLLGDNCIHIETQGLYGHEQFIKESLAREKPNLVVLLGDRYETLVAATVAALLCIPICHIHGGEETEGAVDNAFRHAITKLAYYHFAIHEDYAKRIIQMGESPDRVFVTGAPGVDQYKDGKISNISDTALVCLHPETLGNNEKIISRTLEAISGLQCYVSSANEDIGVKEINTMWREKGIEPQSFSNWPELMRKAGVLIGNSSCFIIEGMTLGKKVINIGDRQKGRYEEALKHFAANKYAYGVPGEVSPKIAELLLTLPIPDKPRKAFHNIPTIIGNGGHAKSVADLKIMGIGGITPEKLCQRLQLIRGGGEYPPLAHPSAWISPSAKIASGAQIMPMASVGACAEIGEGAIINTGAIIEHGARIGAGAHIAPRAVVLGDAIVEEGAFIGVGAIVVQGTVARGFVKALTISNEVK